MCQIRGSCADRSQIGGGVGTLLYGTQCRYARCSFLKHASPFHVSLSRFLSILFALPCDESRSPERAASPGLMRGRRDMKMKSRSRFDEHTGLQLVSSRTRIDLSQSIKNPPLGQKSNNKNRAENAEATTDFSDRRIAVR